MSNPKNGQHHRNDALPIAIIGGSYAGLTIANVLHQNSISYTIFDTKSFPFTHVMGGNADFNVPSYEMIANKLELDKVNDNVENAPTRKDVIESLLQRVKPNLMTCRRIVRMERSRLGLFYLHSMQTHNSKRQQQQQDMTLLGPFQHVVGADGVRSQVRINALPGTFLIGDARWVNDRWYDLGLQRINRGADMALLDGLELGQAIVSVVVETTASTSQHLERSSRFCAWGISWRRTYRLFTFWMVILAMVIFKFQTECQSVCCKIMIYILKDASFCND